LTVIVLIRFRLPPKLLITPHIYSTTVVDADHRGGRTQIFGGNASEPQTSRPVERCNFYLPHLYLAPCWGWTHRHFIEILCVTKL